MTALVFVAVAAMATLARALLTFRRNPDDLPWRTLLVNVTGAFLLGLVLSSSWWDNPMIVTTAGLGSLTTFSTVAAEAASLLDDGRKGPAIAYVGITLVVGVAAALLGLSIGDVL